MSFPTQDCDFLIAGAGVIGVHLARCLREKYPDATILVLEKESAVGAHASGRNSGVLHAGFYYTADSLKARFTRDGCAWTKNFCLENNIPVLENGKLVVAQCDEDLPQIDELLKRAKTNGVELNEISSKEALQLEPNVKFHERILWSPTTAAVDPVQVLKVLTKLATDQKIEFLYGEPYTKRLSADSVQTKRRIIRTKYFVNCAGLYADKVAQDFGFSKNYALLPFKGLYLKSDGLLPGFLKRHIYPVPNLKNPFLGVHFTQTVSGATKIGPTAIPALWRENYKGLENFSFTELIEILKLEGGLLFSSGFDFTSLALEELRKYSKRYLLSQAKNLVRTLPEPAFNHWGPAGIRAQLINLTTKKLEMDYLFEGDKNSFHVLNAVSPAFTCARPFSEFICNKISALL